MKQTRISKNVQKVIDMLEEFDCELVSYGLAPNPFGFCFERGEETTKNQCLELTIALNALSEQDEKVLKKLKF